jgi:dTDP-4-amino-4,6-dideoxygalactose transaminase
LDPKALAERDDLDGVGAVVTVSPFGAPVDGAAWDEFTNRTGIPVVIDAAAAFDTVARIPSSRPGRSPVMISLHATKAFGVGEGGLVLSTDDDVMQRFHQICNFGIWNYPEGQILGYNGKLSEYHAAVGLAGLDSWESRRACLVELTAKYRTALNGHSALALSPDYGNGWVSCYCNVRVKQRAAPVIDRLHEQGIATRRWWLSGVHAQRAYRDFSRDPLPATEALGESVFGLPFFHDITDAQVSRVLEALDAALSVRPSAS